MSPQRYVSEIGLVKVVFFLGLNTVIPILVKVEKVLILALGSIINRPDVNPLNSGCYVFNMGHAQCYGG
jgi:hypothetical protein